MASGQDLGGTTLMDLITSDPVPSTQGAGKAAAGGTVPMHSPPPTFGKDRKTKKPGLMTQIQSDTMSVAKVLTPVKTNIIPSKHKKKPLSYSQLARSIHELAASADQKSSQKQLVHQVFPKLAVYNSVDPSLAPSLVMLHQQCEDRSVLRYIYYYLARILSDTGAQGISAGGGIPTPNWDALADLDAVGGVTRADVVPRIIEQLTAEASNADVEVHARRVAALKALTCGPISNTEFLGKLYEIIFGILDKVADAGKVKRKKGMFGRQTLDKESAIQSNLQYAALSSLRRLPLDPGNPVFLHRAVQGISFADPVAVRHALAMASDIATRDPYAVAMTVAKLALPGGALQEVLHLHDVLARVYLARLCFTLSRARVLDERPDIKSQFTTVLYQLLLDPSERVCFEAIMCILGKFDNTERPEERAAGWARLTSEILKLPEAPSLASKKENNSQVEDGATQSKDGLPPKGQNERPAPRPRRPQALIKLVMRRLESAFRSFSRPVLHAAARVVQEMGKSRAAAFSLGVYAIDEDSHPEAFLENGSMGLTESTDIEHEVTQAKVAPLSSSKETIASMLASLMEAVRTTVACECVYVRAAIIKALIWMQSPNESFDELEAIIASELSDPFWSSSLLNDILLTLHARFKATPEMAVTLLEIARIFATKVPGKIDADVLQLLWKTCLVGAGPGGKHTALEAVTVVLDLPPPQPGSMEGFTSIDRVSASDPKSALALQRLVQAAVWFLGENANYAASEYAWESATPPGTALMMLDADKMVAAASSRNPTLAGALTRLQRWAFSGSWEVRIIAAQALITIAIRSGEPFRLQIYEFLHVLAQGGMQTKFTNTQLSNGEDQGASGTGLSSIIAPMLRVLDEMYKSQDELIKEMRNHDNNKQEWTDDELRKLYETHERLLDLVSLFCYLPRSKYLPLGPISGKLIDIYRNRHHIDAATGFNDPAVAQGISDLILDRKVGQSQYTAVSMETANAWAAHLSDGLLGDDAPGVNLVNEYLAGAGTDAPEVEEENLTSRASVSYDDMWAKTLLEASDGEEDDARSSGTSSPESTASFETSVSSQFGTMHYPSLFSSGQPSYGTASRLEDKSVPGQSRLSNLSTISSSQDHQLDSRVSRGEPPSYESTIMQRFESFENPMAGTMTQDFEEDEEHIENPQFGKALYDFTAGGDDELNLTAGEEVEIEYEVDGWFYVRKKRPGRDGKMVGLVPVLYVSPS
ncbi:uncharacterized protein LOC131065259 [Cryptomeria japonica]|uniref:uncharacterized protein LOC131065259 n=1 Tax=Cryptomeria japonica TaxID=3369 RepID=UPI0027DA72A5|nr:uncharacterized protein LOC131065259 [Cryptomeria japonica]